VIRWLAALVVLVLFWTGPAGAHAVLVESSPVDGAALDRMPATARLTFDEPIAPISAQLVGPAGTTDLPASVSGAVLELALPPDLAAGGYVLSWRVTSADSHPVAGALAFGVGGAAAPVASAAGGRWQTAVTVQRGLFLAALLLAAGGVIAGWLIPGTAPRRQAIMAAWCLLPLAVAGIVLQGLWLADAPLAATADHLGLALTSTRGQAAIAAIAGAILILAGRRLAVAGALVLILSLGLSGHVVAQGRVWAVVLVVHGAIAAFWLGALWPLAMAADRPDVVRRWSRFAIGLVALLLLCGLVLTLLQLGGWPADVRVYVNALLIKLTAVAGLLGLAAWHRLRLAPRLPHAAAALRRGIALEAVLFVIVLGATAVMGQNEPPRTQILHHAAEDGVTVVAVDDDVMVTATLGRRPARLVLHLADQAGKPVEPREVTVTLAPADVPGAGYDRPAVHTGPGQWQAEGLILPHGGNWRLTVVILVDDFTRSTIGMTMPVR
jgi:copper transport protein